MYEYRRGGSVFGAFLLGGLVGAALGLLFAPRSGKETRDVIAARAEEYWGQGVDLYHTGVERAGEVYEQGRETVTVKGEELRGRIDEARGRWQEKVAKSAETAGDKVADVVPAAKEAVDKAADATKGGIDTAGGKAQESLDFVSRKAKGDESETLVDLGTPLGTPLDTPDV